MYYLPAFLTDKMTMTVFLPRIYYSPITNIGM